MWMLTILVCNSENRYGFHRSEKRVWILLPASDKKKCSDKPLQNTDGRLILMVEMAGLIEIHVSNIG